MSAAGTLQIDRLVALPQDSVAGAWSRIREICCETALSGRPIADRTRWPFFGELWIAPYQKRFPEWTWVARGETGGIEGYLTGCPDTRRQHRYLRWRHHPALLLGILLQIWPWTVDTRSFVRRTFRLSPHPERLFERKLLRSVLRDFPAHLHVNVSEALRSRGAGAALVDAYAGALREAGLRGVHLFCGPAPVRFYERCGFTVAATREIRTGSPVHLMTMPIRRT